MPAIDIRLVLYSQKEGPTADCIIGTGKDRAKRGDRKTLEEIEKRETASGVLHKTNRK